MTGPISTISTDEVVKYGSDIVNTNSSFKKIKETVDWLDKYNTKEYSLNLSKYREEQKLLKAKMGELDKLYKLTKELNVKNTETDLAALKDAQDKLDKNNQWLKRISGDIYIDETVKVMNNMIGQSNTAKNN